MWSKVWQCFVLVNEWRSFAKVHLEAEIIAFCTKEEIQRREEKKKIKNKKIK